MWCGQWIRQALQHQIKILKIRRLDLSKELILSMPRLIILQGLGEVPFACMIQYQAYPQRMWNFLRERYGSKTTFARATLHPKLGCMRFIAQSMLENIAEWESYWAQMASMNAKTNEGLLMTVLMEWFGDRIESLYGGVITALLTNEELAWQNFTSRILHKHISLRLAKSPTKKNDEETLITKSKFVRNKRQTYKKDLGHE